VVDNTCVLLPVSCMSVRWSAPVFVCAARSAFFFFGLYEAGTLMEAPVKAVSTLVPLDDLKASLSDDLTTLVDDPEENVPVFLPAQ
jgi:predicted membrane chloride channel (bestrophin family)